MRSRNIVISTNEVLIIVFRSRVIAQNGPVRKSRRGQLSQDRQRDGIGGA